MSLRIISNNKKNCFSKNEEIIWKKKHFLSSKLEQFWWPKNGYPFFCLTFLVSSQTWTKLSHLDLTSNLWPWALQLELRSQKCCHVQQACRVIRIAASSRASRAMDLVTVSHIHLASRLSSWTRTSRGVFRGGWAAGPLFGNKKDFNQCHRSGNWLYLNFYICKFSVAPKLWILHLFF